MIVEDSPTTRVVFFPAPNLPASRSVRLRADAGLGPPVRPRGRRRRVTDRTGAARIVMDISSGA